MSKKSEWSSFDTGKQARLASLRRKFYRTRVGLKWLLRVKRQVFFFQEEDGRAPALEILAKLLLECDRDLLQLEKARLELKGYLFGCAERGREAGGDVELSVLGVDHSPAARKPPAVFGGGEPLLKKGSSRSQS